MNCPEIAQKVRKSAMRSNEKIGREMTGTACLLFFASVLFVSNGWGQCGNIEIKDTSVSYKSITGIGNLVGFSGYRQTGNTQDNSDPTAPWNAGPIWKWKQRNFSGALWTDRHQFGDCNEACAYAQLPGGDFGRFTGTAEIGPDGFISYAKQFAPLYEVPCDTPWVDTTHEIFTNHANHSKCTLTETLITRSLVLDDTSCADGWTYRSELGGLYQTLSHPDTIAAALKRSTQPKVEGKFHRTYISAVDTTTPEVTEPIAISGRGVTITLNGICPGKYRVEAVLRTGQWDGFEAGGEAKYKSTPAPYDKRQTVATVEIKDNGEGTFETPTGKIEEVTEVLENTIVLYPAVNGKTIGTPDGCRVNSVDFGMHLGSVTGGLSAGLLRIKEDDLTPASFTPAALNLLSFSDDDVEVVRDTLENLRQILVPEGLADIVTLSTTSYEIRVYLASQVGSLDTGTGFYAVSGTPLVTYTIAEASGSTALNPKLSLTETRGSKAIETVFSQNGDNWEATYGNGLKTERLTYTTEGDLKVETRELVNLDNSVAQVTVKKTRTYSFGEKTIEEITGSGAAAVTTTYRYYDNATTDGLALGEMKTRQTSAGNWESWTYDTEGRKAKRVSQFLDSTFESADNLNRVTTWTYATVTDLDGDGKDEALETQTDTLLGQETGRRHRLVLTATGGLGPNGETAEAWTEEREIVCTVPGAAWDASTNLVTITRTGVNGLLQYKTVWTQRPDGTATSLLLDPQETGGRIWTTLEGALQLDGSITGRRTEVIEDELGRERERNVYENGLLVAAAVVMNRDELGRPTLTAFLDGTEERREYSSCCGLASFRSRDGILTTYEHDDLGRVTRETVGGVSTVYEYDAAGRVISTTRVGSDDSQIPVSTQTYDTAGRLLTSTDALNRTTTYTETLLSGSLTERKTVHADTSEEISTFYPDGSPASVRGDAAQWHNYAYGVDTDGEYEQEYFPTGDEPTGTPAAQWVKRYRDHAGRNHLVRYPDNAEETSGYNAKGQLVRQTDADGVQTLFAYNDRGEQTVTALDLDRNGTIDYAGDDRITRTVTTYATRDSVTVRRTTTEVWEDAGDNPVTVSVTETAVDSLQSWTTTRGLTTHTSVTQDGAGNRTETTTAPDGSTSILTYAHGRLTGETRKDANNNTLSQVAYAYDPHGRLVTQTATGIGTTTYSYFDDDQVATVTTPDPGDGTQTTSYTYNNRGWPSKVTHPDAAETETTYYPTGQIKRTWGARTYPQEYTYDAQGRLKTLTTWKDFSGTTGEAVTTWNYDPQRGWLTQKLYADNQGPAYTYTPAGRLATRTWARGVVTTYGYTDAGDLASVTYSDSTPAVAHTYDRAGRLHTTTDAAGLLTRSYANGQLTGEVYSGTGLLAGKSVTHTFDSLQRQDSLSATSIQPVSYTYDAASRLATVTQGDLSASYSYHPNLGTVTGVTVSNSSTERARQERTFDVLGRITRVDTLGNGSILHARRDYTYNAANQRTQVTHEDSRHWTYGYDTLGQVTSAQKRLSDNTALPGYDFGYSFDDIGNRMSTTTNGRTAAYLSDALNRYTQRDYPGAIDVRGSASTAVTVLVNDGLTTRTGEDFFRAAPFDNDPDPVNAEIKIQAVDPGPPEQVATETRSFATTGRTDPYIVPSDPEAFTHDADGNLTQDGRWNYTWDAENRLISMEMRYESSIGLHLVQTRLEFAYDSQSRRLTAIMKILSPSAGWMVVDSKQLLYDGWNLLAEYDQLNAGQLLRSHVWGLDLSGSSQGAGGVGGLLWSNTSTAAYVPGYDANGNIIAWINTTDGSLAGLREYGAFGESVMSTGISEELPFGFSTKYQDRLTGLHYYGYRYYSTILARWLGNDPLEERGGINLYAMVGNDLVNQWDYLGLEPLTEVPPEGKFVLRIAKNIKFNDDQAKRALVPYDSSQGGYYGDGFEVEYQPADTCPCIRETIRLVQAIKIGSGDSRIDASDYTNINNANANGSAPLPGYTQDGGRQGAHGSTSYFDAPYNAWSNFWGNKQGKMYQFEVCALCPDGTILGCFSFNFHNNERIPRPTGTTPASSPGKLWRSAVERWEKASAPKNRSSIKYLQSI
ncbi:type IV secretion protein Rhs [Opitutaceae bacterium TAV5]|nr:type IV secretion protein Rhs [Opitutaceae bacterium TAV5]